MMTLIVFAGLGLVVIIALICVIVSDHIGECNPNALRKDRQSKSRSSHP